MTTFLLLFSLWTGTMAESAWGSPTPTWNPYRPHYTFFATYASNGQSLMGSAVDLPTSNPNLRLGLIYWMTQHKSYGGMSLDYRKFWGSASFSIHLQFLTPLSQSLWGRSQLLPGRR